MKAIYLAILLILATSYISSSPSFALSEYGRKCDENPDCTRCRDSDAECSRCMNACWNLYGPAEVNATAITSHDKEELCRIRRAKWCNAQCWDPDDKKDPDYESTKPQCSTTTAFPNYQRTKRPW
ncbi:MAG: hypothetical protein K0R98_446 [Rickettsiaceae bacterium]|jgi:hypothetical protein|nr:hypothetical protein [Rickettsiaceae bacterium]